LGGSIWYSLVTTLDSFSSTYVGARVHLGW
jgi:hypothetical protein